MAILYRGNDDSAPSSYFETCDVVIDEELERSYELGERIRSGGNGVVHRCIDRASGDEYAIKFQLDRRPDRLERFRREQTILNGLSHVHLMTYVGSGWAPCEQVTGRGRRVRRSRTSLPFIVMSLANCSLFDTVRNGTVPEEIYIAQFRGLARALGILHEKALHRDIKPDNILVIGERWVLSDYGLCCPYDCVASEPLTPDARPIGPRFWMSPEANNRSVGRNEPIDTASDVFQLAAVFWFVVNRSHPTGVLTTSDWKGPKALYEPIHLALHHDRSVRPQNGLEFAKRIDAAVLS